MRETQLIDCALTVTSRGNIDHLHIGLIGHQTPFDHVPQLLSSALSWTGNIVNIPMESWAIVLKRVVAEHNTIAAKEKVVKPATANPLSIPYIIILCLPGTERQTPLEHHHQGPRIASGSSYHHVAGFYRLYSLYVVFLLLLLAGSLPKR